MVGLIATALLSHRCHQPCCPIQRPNQGHVFASIPRRFAVGSLAALRTGIQSSHGKVGTGFVEENQILQLDFLNRMPVLHPELLDSLGVAFTRVNRFFPKLSLNPLLFATGY